MTTPWLRRGLSALIVALTVAFTVGEAPHAGVRILWRFAVLSFDSPATQAIDELVCESSPPSQAGAEARQWTRLAAGGWAPIAPPALPAVIRAGHLSSGITRAPPSA